MFSVLCGEVCVTIKKIRIKLEWLSTKKSLNAKVQDATMYALQRSCIIDDLCSQIQYQNISTFLNIHLASCKFLYLYILQFHQFFCHITVINLAAILRAAVHCFNGSLLNYKLPQHLYFNHSQHPYSIHLRDILMFGDMPLNSSLLFLYLRQIHIYKGKIPKHRRL